MEPRSSLPPVTVPVDQRLAGRRTESCWLRPAAVRNCGTNPDRSGRGWTPNLTTPSQPEEPSSFAGDRFSRSQQADVVPLSSASHVSRAALLLMQRVRHAGPTGTLMGFGRIPAD